MGLMALILLKANSGKGKLYIKKNGVEVVHKKVKKKGETSSTFLSFRDFCRDSLNVQNLSLSCIEF
jgi:predicted peroxiredoxin